MPIIRVFPDRAGDTLIGGIDYRNRSAPVDIAALSGKSTKLNAGAKALSHTLSAGLGRHDRKPPKQPTHDKNTNKPKNYPLHTSILPNEPLP